MYSLSCVAAFSISGVFATSKPAGRLAAIEYDVVIQPSFLGDADLADGIV
jgi:hypothetical protein